MPWHTIKNEARISAIFRHLISRQRGIKISIDGKKKAFNSKLVKLNHIPSEKGQEAQLVIQRPNTAEDIELFRALSEARMEFIVKKKFCKCETAYIGSVYDEGDFALLLAFPSSLQVHEERREDRVNLELLEPVSAKLTVEKGPDQLRTYDLPVVDYSRHGLGLLVSRNAFDLLGELNVGDPIRDMVLYAPWAVATVDGKVVHKTELQDGNHKGCFMLGIKSRQIITNDPVRKR